MEKVQQKQEINSFGVLSVFFLMVLCLFFLFPVWNRGSKDQKEFTMRRAESLAYQIIEVRIGVQRAPASEAESALNHLFSDNGEIGLDTWGRPFRFKVVKSQSDRSRVLVWSLGPNGSNDSEVFQFDLEQNNGPAALAGDDLGIMLSIH